MLLNVSSRSGGCDSQHQHGRILRTPHQQTADYASFFVQVAQQDGCHRSGEEGSTFPWMKGSVDAGSGIADPGFGEVAVRRKLRGAYRGLSGGVCSVAGRVDRCYGSPRSLHGKCWRFATDSVGRAVVSMTVKCSLEATLGRS